MRLNGVNTVIEDDQDYYPINLILGREQVSIFVCRLEMGQSVSQSPVVVSKSGNNKIPAFKRPEFVFQIR
ncbi:hypothetical protein D3C72_817690 [compost metagenome]